MRLHVYNTFLWTLVLSCMRVCTYQCLCSTSSLYVLSSAQNNTTADKSSTHPLDLPIQNGDSSALVLTSSHPIGHSEIHILSALHNVILPPPTPIRTLFATAPLSSAEAPISNHHRKKTEGSGSAVERKREPLGAFLQVCQGATAGGLCGGESHCTIRLRRVLRRSKIDPTVSTGDRPLTKKPEDSGYEIGYKIAFALDFRLPGSPCIMSKKFAFGPVLNCSGEREELLFQYTTPGGGVAEVPRFVQPHNVLQVDRNASKGDIKAAFFRVANRTRRQERVMASLSYNILMSEIQRYRKISSETYEIHRVNDVVVLAAVGATAALLARVSRDKSLLTLTDEHKHTLLYLTARSGFYDTTEALLKIGVPVNERQVDGSTPLHAASFYGQRLVVELLLRYGADASITNKWGNTPADEAYSTELKEVILSHKEDLVSQIVHSLIGKGLVHRVHLVESQGTVIGREVVRHPEAIDEWTRRMLDSITSSWVTVWHGTKSRHLESILRNGLKP